MYYKYRDLYIQSMRVNDAEHDETETNTTNCTLMLLLIVCTKFSDFSNQSHYR